MLADKYSRFALMFVGYTISAVSWILYGTTTNLTFFIIINVVEGFAIAFSYPPKQAFLIQVSPPKWLGTVTGIEATSMQLAGMIGTFLAPVLYDWMSGYVLALGGVVSLVGLAATAPVLHREWRRLSAQGPVPSTSELESRDGALPVTTAEPPSSLE
jgi:MFS family permease